MCTLILRPSTAGPQRKKVVSVLTRCTDPATLMFSFFLPSLSCLSLYILLPDPLLASTPLCLSLNTHLPHFPLSLPLCVSDPGEGGGGSPPRGGAGSVPAADRAKPGTSPTCSPNSLPLWTCQDLPGHLSGTCPGSPLDRDAIDPDASPSHPR